MNTNVKQHDITDCAAACISSIARHYGKNIPLTVIREASGTSRTGTTIKGVIDGCREVGFKAEAFKSDEKDVESLMNVPFPVILHVLTKLGDLHFMVLYGRRKGKAVVMDPAVGDKVRLSSDELKEIWTGYIITVAPDMLHDEGERYDKASLLNYLRLIPVGEYVSMALGSAAYIIAGICTAVFLQHIIDDIIPGSSPKELFSTSAIMLALMLSTLAAGYMRMLNSLRVSIKIDSRLALGYLDHLFRLPIGFFTGRGAGELHSRLNDTAKIRSFLAEGIITLITSLLLICFSFILMFTCHWRLALLMLTFIPVYLIIYLVAAKVNKKMNRSIMEGSAAFEEKAVEGMNSVKLIKHFGSEGAIFSAIEKRYVDLANRLFRSGKYMSIFASSSDAVSKLLTITLLTIGSIFIFQGSLTTGELVSFYTLSAYFSAPLGQIVDICNQLSEARISSERLSDIMDLEVEGTMKKFLPAVYTEDIIFKEITFSYAGCPTLLENFNMVIHPGAITAIQGESGCGKSSLASLLMRDYRVSRGKILLGDTDISLIDLQEWRKNVSILPQEPEMLNCSILDNITCLEKTPDIRRISSILDDLGLHEFISNLPLGLLTPIGDRGCALSGGQKQRIALARALYRDPQILILDEATASLDETSQSYVLKKIVELRNEGKTIVMITHKNDNVKIADCIIRL